MTSTTSIPAIRQAAQILQQAQRIVVLSGAGISKASGIPTYRDTDGLWETGDNLKYSHIDAYRKNPAAFTQFWAARRREITRAYPNPAHHALAKLQQQKPNTLFVTQNVDGLLQQAECQNVLELHGNLRTTRCCGCGRRNAGTAFGRCIRCFSRVRPDVVLFGETLPEDVFLEATVGASKCDVLLVVGTSAVVNPAAQLPEIALRHHAKLIVLDVEPPLLAYAAHVFVQGKAEVLLPQLVDRGQRHDIATS